MWNKNLLGRVLGGAGLAVGIFSALNFWGCEGSATQTTNTGLHGILVDTDGRPVSGAKVKAWPVAASPNGILNSPENILEISTETNSLGHYSIPKLDVGIYNIYGDKGNGHSTIYIPRVRYVDKEIFVGRDTLLPPGVITGKVVAEGRGLAMVFCYVQGSSYLVMTDTSGLFTLKDIPMGTYTLNYHSRGYLTAVDSPITVVSGATTTLMPKTMVRYLALGPASPTILASEYDTLTGRLFLVWNRVRDEKVASYTLEYFPMGHPELAVSSRISGLTDTVLESYFPRNFFVQVYRPGEDPVPLNFFKLEYLYGKEAELTMEFRILSVDSLGNISQYKGNPTEIRMPRPEALDNPVKLELAEGDMETTQCRDTLVFIIGFQKPVTARYDINWYEGFQKRPPVGSVTSKGPWTSGNITPMRSQTHPDTLKWIKKDIWANRMMNHSDEDSIGMDMGSVAIDVKLKGWQIEDPRRIDFDVDSSGCFRIHKSYRPQGQAGDKYWWQY